MQLSIVVAVADDLAIGKNGQLPWHLPADLRFFKEKTKGKPIIMGRHTFESLGKPLKDRFNIVLSHSLKEAPEGTYLFTDLQEAIAAAETEGFTEACAIGGSSVFAEAARVADILFITRVHTTVPDADTFFPELDMHPWTLAWEEAHEADEKNKIPYTFQRWERKS